MPVRSLIVRMARNMLPSLVVNAVCPALLYIYLRRLYPDPSLVPISLAALFPVFGNVYSLIRTRSLDTFGTIMFFGFGFTLVAIFVSGDQRIILVSRSALTLGMGLFALVSLLLPRPISFYFARQFIAGNDHEQVRRFDSYWRIPYVRFVCRVTSLVWAATLVAEFTFRVVVVYTLPVAEVLVLTPIVFNVFSMTAMAWTAWYGTRALPRIRRESVRLQPA
ncbi:MAG: VC0807 family protein [Candidatus Dormibacteraceae bacterium]